MLLLVTFLRAALHIAVSKWKLSIRDELTKLLQRVVIIPEGVFWKRHSAETDVMCDEVEGECLVLC